MASTAQSMEFERAVEYRDLIQAIGTLPDQATGYGRISQNRDVFGYYVGQGLDVVSRFSLSVKENSSSGCQSLPLLQ